MKHGILVFFLVLASFFAQGTRAAEKFPGGDFSELRRTGAAKVVNVIDPQTVQIDDGRILRLAGLDFPDLTVQEAGDLALTALEVLRDMFEGENVEIFQTQDAKWGRVNHMGHEIAHIARTSDGAWAQGTLLSLGLARAQTSQRNPEMAAQMYTLEESARAAKLGLWDMDAYKILKPEEAEAHLDSFQVVEGQVASVSLKNNRIFLNFGPDWRSDFTVSIAPADKRSFIRSGSDPMAWNAKNLRVRGWVRSYNGAYMEIDHPQAVEVLPGDSAPPHAETGAAPTIEGSALPAISDTIAR